jgi:hypothetical protein
VKRCHLYLGRTAFNTDSYATLFDDILILNNDFLPPLVIQWKCYYIVGGIFWRQVPNLVVRNTNKLVLYRDTLMSLITWPLRLLLIPGYRPKDLWLRLRKRRNNSWA